MNANRKTIRTIFRILALLWMCFIFSMSARNGDLSTDDSNTVGYYIAWVVVPSFQEMDTFQQQVYIDAMDFGIRKCAHASEYAVLAILVFLSFGDGSYIRPWVYTVLFAMTDECHQLFVPGRSGQIMDVGIDGIGALAGLAMVWLSCQIVGGIKLTLIFKR